MGGTESVPSGSLGREFSVSAQRSRSSRSGSPTVPSHSIRGPLAPTSPERKRDSIRSWISGLGSRSRSLSELVATLLVEPYPLRLPNLKFLLTELMLLLFMLIA